MPSGVQKKLLRLRPKGLNTDLSPVDTAGQFYYSMNNVAMRDGTAQATPLDDPVAFTYGVPRPTDPEYLLFGEDSAGVRYYIGIGDTDAVAVTNAGTSFDLTPIAGGAVYSLVNNPTGGNINGFPFFAPNSTLDEPLYWDLNTANNFALLPDWTATFGGGTPCGALRAFDDFLVAMNVNNPEDFHWSSRAAPGAVPAAWGPLATNEAGNGLLADTPGAVVDGGTLRDQFMIYKNTSAYLLQQTGLPEVMTVRKVFDSIGCANTNCYQEYNGVHYLMTPDDIVAHDGRSAKSIITSQVRGAYRDATGPFYAAWNPVFNELWAVIGSSALIFNGDSWSQRDIGSSSRQTEGNLTTMPYITRAPVQLGTSTREILYGVAPTDTANGRRIVEMETTAQIRGYPTVTATASNVQVRGIIPNPQGRVRIHRIWPIMLEADTPAAIDPHAMRLIRYPWSGDSLGTFSDDGTVYEFEGGVAGGDPFMISADQVVSGYEFGLEFFFADNRTTNPVWKLAGFDIEYSDAGER